MKSIYELFVKATPPERWPRNSYRGTCMSLKDLYTREYEPSWASIATKK